MLRTVLMSFAAIVLLTGPAQKPVSVGEAGHSTLIVTATSEAGTATQPLGRDDRLDAPADGVSKPPAENIPPAPAAAKPPLVPGDVMVAPVKRVMPKPFADTPPAKDAKTETGAKPETKPAKISAPNEKPAAKIKPKTAPAKEPSGKKLSRN